MQPENIRNRGEVASRLALPLAVSIPALLAASPALAADGASLWTIAPLVMGIGAMGFGLAALAAIRRLRHQARLDEERMASQVSGMRALVDQYEALLAGAGEVTVLWSHGGSPPRFLGPATLLLPQGRPLSKILDFSEWLPAAEADTLARHVEALRVSGRPFEAGLKSLDGRAVRATGWGLGDGAAMRLRPAFQRADDRGREGAVPRIDLGPLTAMIAGWPDPAFVRDATGRLVHVNDAWHALAARLGHPSSAATPADLLPVAARPRVMDGKPHTSRVSFTGAGSFDLVEIPFAGGETGGLRLRSDVDASPAAVLNHVTGIIEQLTVPIAVFNATRELVLFNRAYVQLFGLDPGWLRSGPDERSVLDRLRTENKLPSEADYHAWRARHLASYSLKAPREESWHLPDGTTLKVLAAPAGPGGGVVYVFEDITVQLELKSTNRALLEVQRSTLNALSEAVAVFGTNGKLTLSNPRLSTLWKLPMNELGQNPHIDQIADASARAMPIDGAGIWRDLKRGIIDLNPNRADLSGRISRSDGRLLDYAIVRLPDGQTMMTFIDVTESANYSRVLKERNDALVTADRLKDAFVQNVSYELRSPLTNIIGFAELLDSEAAGPLNARQRSYTEFIRASSATLGVLVDNILDLATVDAGIAELRLEQHDVATLVEKAKAGLDATFPAVDGERSVNVTVDLAPHLPPLVADGTRIVQVLYNLLSSAARFSERGGEVHLSVSAVSDRMLFVVEDDGREVGEEMTTAMTEGADTGTRQRGAGLALAIVRSFVNLHGGTLTIQRREPRGSRVIVNLPRRAVSSGALGGFAVERRLSE